MAKIDELIPKLKEQADAEDKIFAGKEQREFFIEMMNVNSVDELLKLFDPKEHNEKWDAERQKPAPEQEELMLQRRAVAYMVAGKRDVHRHYKETELSAYVMGRMRMAWEQNALDQTKYFTTMKSVKG